MKRISFVWTVEALRAGRKTVTRRAWKNQYAWTFRKGTLVAAYDRQTRHGGHQVATIRLTADPIKDSTALAPDEDYEAEGFAYMEEHGLKVDGLPPKTLWRAWQLYPQFLWVIRFELVPE